MQKQKHTQRNGAGEHNAARGPGTRSGCIEETVWHHNEINAHTYDSRSRSYCRLCALFIKFSMALGHIVGVSLAHSIH